MIVVDAGLVVAALVAGDDAADLRRALIGQDLAAPALLDVEVVSALRGLRRGRQLTDGRARAALDDLADLPIRRHDHGPLLARCWQLRDNLTAYDATYVALAELFEVELWTTDQRLARAPGLRCQVQTPL